jgi:hypothetical protein
VCGWAEIAYRRVPAVRWTGIAPIPGGCAMPNRMRCRDKPLDRQMAIEYKGVKEPSAVYPTVYYTDRKQEHRI